MEFKAFKMDGLGNDFVIIDNRQKIIELSKEQIKNKFVFTPHLLHRCSKHPETNHIE